jgi:ADP-ribose pyrophosphatase YjhB (NUDIX family)
LNILKVCPFCGRNLVIVEIGGRDRLACPSTECEFVHWDNPKPVTATLVPMESGLVLVQRKFEPFIGDWCLPGGFIEHTEHPAESAAREVLEETGLVIESPRLIGAGAPGHGVNVVIMFYMAQAVGGQMIAGDDASDVRAFRQNELPPNVAFEMHREMVRRFFAGEFNP